MSELFTSEECVAFFRAEVAAAGGAKKWLKKNNVFGLDHVLHMVEDGSYFTHPRVLQTLGFRKVERWEAVKANG